MPAAAPPAMVALTVTVPAAVVWRVFPVMAAPVVPALTTVHAIVLFVTPAGFTVPVSGRAVPAVAAVKLKLLVRPHSYAVLHEILFDLAD